MASIGDYELETELGSGASGTVWMARRTGVVAQQVALKRLRIGRVGPTERGRIQQEATVLTELDHPHVVRVLDVLQDEEGLALALQYAPGGSLEALLRERGRLPPGEVVAIAAPMAEALASAHRKGILHGDVKPANILFTSDGEPLLGDFGVARTLGAPVGANVAGSALYLAPEILDAVQRAATDGSEGGGFGTDRTDARSDIYSLGVVCYRALTGVPPHAGDTPEAVLQAAARGRHRSVTAMRDIAGVAPELAKVVEMAIARHPEQRFASADDLAVSLRSSVASGSVRLPGLPENPTVPVADDDLTGATDTFGPRPPAPKERHVGFVGRLVKLPARACAAGLRGVSWAAGQVVETARGRPLAAGLIVAGVMVLTGAWLMVAGGSGGGGEGAPETGGRPAVSCVDDQPPEVSPEAQVIAADLNGDGCTGYAVYEERDLADGPAMVLTVDLEGDRRDLLLGEPGDQVVLGDWSCDGRDTPALYRPSTGEVRYFMAWPDGDRSSDARPTEADPHGVADVERNADGTEPGTCDQVLIVPDG